MKRIHSSGDFATLAGLDDPSGLENVFSVEVVRSSVGRPEVNPSRLLIDLSSVAGNLLSPEILRTDATILNELMAKYADDAIEMIKRHQKPESAAEIAERIGLTEQAFQSRGGGFWVLLAVVAAALVSSGCVTIKPLVKETPPP